MSKAICLPLPFGHEVLFRFPRIQRREAVWVEGISARTPDGYVVFLDYDCASPSYVFEDVERLQEEFALGNGYIFQTWKRGFHAIIPEIHPLGETFEILHASNADPSHATSYRYNLFRTWVLRSGPKGAKGSPVFVKTVFSRFIDNLKSLGHLEYLAARGVPPEDLLWDPNNGVSGVIRNFYQTKRW